MVTMNALKLEELSQNVKGISKSFGDYMAECCAVCLNSQKHKSGVILSVFEHENSSIQWSISINDDILLSHQDEKRTTDFGAMGISILLTKTLTDYTTFISSETNNGIDFWLMKDDDDLNFFFARLEISGIRKESVENSVKKRLKVKEKQIQKKANNDTPCYISIVEFGEPKILFIKHASN
jgi:hypothetical protein